MNAALFMLTSAWMAGDGAPVVAAPAPAPAVVSTGSACGSTCGGCASSCGEDACCGKAGFFSRFRGHKSSCCDTAPTCCAPAPTCCSAPIAHYKPASTCCTSTCATSSCCDTGCDTGCGKHGGFFSRFRGHKSSCCDTGCDTGCNSCGSGAPGVIAPSVINPRPETIPAPKDKKEMPKAGVTGIQVSPVVTPVVSPRPPIEVGGSSNPF